MVARLVVRLGDKVVFRLVKKLFYKSKQPRALVVLVVSNATLWGFHAKKVLALEKPTRGCFTQNGKIRTSAATRTNITNQ